MKIGYIRVSSVEQNTIRQEHLMRELGVERVYIDKCSGKNTDRPQLQEMLGYVREGDTVIVSEISRFARNTRDLLELVDELNGKGVEFISQKEKIDTTTPTGQFMLTIFAAVAQLEREYIKSRQKEGIEIAKQAGRYKGRLPIAVDAENFKNQYRLWKSGEITAVECMKRLNLKANTFYRRVREYENS